jgi:hypothetical protein
MVPTLFFYHLGLIALVCIFLILCSLGPNHAAAHRQLIVPPKPPRRTHSKEPKPFSGLTQRPQCALCEHEAAHPPVPPPTPPEPMPPTNRRPRAVNTSQHFAPIGAVAIVAGWGEAIYAPMAIPMAAPGANSSAPRVRGISRSTTARSFMASRSPGS